MRKNRFIGQDRCYHLISRLAHRAFFLDDEEKDRAVALMRRVEAGVQAGMSYCINRTVSISSDPFDPYDIFGNKTTMTTYRDETSRTGGSPVQGDVTTWLYDSASGSLWDLGKDGMTLTMSAWKGGLL